MQSKPLSVKDIAWELLLWVVLPLAIVFGTEPLYRESLYKTSIEITPDLQKMEEIGPLMKVVSALGSGGAIGTITILLFNIMPKPTALYIWCGVGFTAYLFNELKSFYGEHRPYWDSSDIHTDRCRTDFGNPSGHMLFNTCFWVTLYLHYCVGSPSSSAQNS